MLEHEPELGVGMMGGEQVGFFFPFYFSGA